MQTLKNLLFTILLSIPIPLIAQDTLVANISVHKNEQGLYEVTYKKDLRYPDVVILEVIFGAIKFDGINTRIDTVATKPEVSPKIRKM